MKKVNFVILAAGVGYKMRSYEPRSLLKFNDTCLINHQIKQIEKIKEFGLDSNIFVITGYKSDKIEKKLTKEKITIINNENYSSCGQGGSLRLLQSTHNLSNMFIVHGDIYFELNKFLKYDNSFLLYDNKFRLKDKEVGVNIGDQLVGSLSYGVKTKWAQMVYLNEKEINLLNKTLVEKNDFMTTHEVINSVIDYGGKIHVVPQNDKLFEVDRIKEYNIESFNFE